MSKKGNNLGEREFRELRKLLPLDGYVSLTRINILKVPEKWFIEPRVIPDFHLLFVCRGKGTYWINGKGFPLCRGRVVLLGGTTQYAAVQDVNDPLVIIPIRFEFKSRENDQCLSSFNQALEVSYVSRKIDFLEGLFKGLFQLNQRGFDDKDGLIASYMNVILENVLTEWDQLNSQKIDYRLLKVYEWMQENPLDRSSIDELANKATLSTKYFTKLFKQSFHCTPKHFQVQLRMQYAKYMLVELNASVKQVAFDLQYADPYIFSKQFKDFFGKSPTALIN